MFPHFQIVVAVVLTWFFIIYLVTKGISILGTVRDTYLSLYYVLRYNYNLFLDSTHQFLGTNHCPISGLWIVIGEQRKLEGF